MSLPGVCTECGEPLTGKQKYTCSDTCRSGRSRRLKRKKSDAGKATWAGDAELRGAIDRAMGDVSHEVMKEELRPVVREAISEDALRAIQGMVALTPRAVECMYEDLHSDDMIIRQRAYTLLMKYTVGHQAIVRPEEAQPQGLVVNFNLPRPGDEVDGHGAATELEAEEIRECDVCHEEKPITQFVAGSQRCVTCYEEQRAFAASLMKDGDD